MTHKSAPRPLAGGTGAGDGVRHDSSFRWVPRQADIGANSHATSWVCVDCGSDTAPGIPSREEQSKLLAAGEDLERYITSQSEIYAVRDAVWAKARMQPRGGCLCIGCLEKRLGRELRIKDFLREHNLNARHLRGTTRLLKRRGARS
jgi:hypothetical protein